MKLNQESVNDKLTCDNLSPDLSLLTIDSCPRSTIASPLGNSPFVNSQESIFSPVPKDAFTSNNCPEILLNVINSLSMSNSNVNPLIANSKPFGLKLPVVVSSTVNSLPPISLKSECLASCSKPACNVNVLLDNCLQTPAVNPLANQIPSLTSGISCSPKPLATGFKSSFTVSSSTNCESGLKPPVAQLSINSDAVPQSKNPNLLGQPEIGSPVSHCNSLLSSQTLNNIGSTMPSPAASGITLCNLAPNTPVGCNAMDQIANLSPNTLSNTCSFSPLIPGAPGSNQGFKSPIVSSAIISANKLVASVNNPPISPALNLASGLTPQVTSPCSSEIPNLMPEPNDCATIPSSIIPQQSVILCPLSKPTLTSFNENNFAVSFCNYQTQFPLSPDVSLIPTVQDCNVCPNNQMCPQSDCPISDLNPLVDPNLLLTNDIPILPNTSPPLSVNQFSPINKYFKDVRAATAKLNDFVTSFSSKLASKNIPQLQSFVAPSQMPSLQPKYMPYEEMFDSSSLLACPRPVSTPPPVPTSFLQSNIISCDTPVAKIPTVTSIQSYVDNTAFVTPPVVPVTFKAPIVPKKIVSEFNFPIYSTPVQCNNFQDNLASILSTDYSPYLLTSFATTIPSNPFINSGLCGNNLSDGPLLPTVLPTIPSIRPKCLLSDFKGPLSSTYLPNPIITTSEDVTSVFMPDLLSCILPKSSYGCDFPCKKPFPYISSISINSSPDCKPVVDSCVTPSVLNECTLDSLPSSILSSPIASFLTSKPTLDESQLGLCCRNLENMISLLESSTNFNGEVDCDLDSLSNILSCL